MLVHRPARISSFLSFIALHILLCYHLSFDPSRFEHFLMATTNHPEYLSSITSPVGYSDLVSCAQPAFTAVLKYSVATLLAATAEAYGCHLWFL